MILELSFNKYKLFKEKNVFSLKADKRTQYLLSNSVEIDNVAILKALSIYGPNNSGKTLIIRLFKLLKKVLFGEDKIVFNNLDLFSDSSETSVYLIYNNLDGKGWIKYEFTFDSSKKIFTKELLSTITYYSNGAPFENKIFEKSIYDKILTIHNDDYSKFLSILPYEKPFLHTINVDDGEFNTLREWKDSLIQCANNIEILSMYNIPIQKTIDFLKGEDVKKHKFINAFVKAADVSISGFEYRDDILFNPNEHISEKALSSYNDSIDTFKLTTTYGNKKVPSIFFDSTGTKKIEAFASYIYDAINEGKTLIVDELDNGLHYSLSRAIVSSFNNMVNKKGQIIFTAHDLLLIDCKNLMRKDQIYFLSRKDDSSYIMSLKSVTAYKNGLREGDSLVKRYNHGDFGQPPLPNFVKEIIMLLNNN